MKKIISFLAICFLLVTFTNANTKYESIKANSNYAFEMMQPCTLVVTVSGGLHKRSTGCTGLALGCLKVGVSFNSFSTHEETTELGLEMRSSNVISLSAIYTDKIDTPYFEVEEDTPLNEKLCNQLGYTSIVIRKGMYKYTRDKSNLLSVDLNCVTKK